MMANNENPGYTHEKRKLGAKFRHEDGWGAGWLENGALRVRKSPRSILRDGSVAELDSVQTDLIILHARRASNPRSARQDVEARAHFHKGNVMIKMRKPQDAVKAYKESL